MSNKIQNLKPDIILKNYWRNNEQFADLFNAVLFDGEPVIKPEELEDADTEESAILEHKEYAESIQASRDNIKISKKSIVHGVEYVLLGNENQQHIHYAIPLRVMGYDYSTYKKQYESNAKKCKTLDGIDEDEYLSRMRRTDKFIPVITVVLYYGDKTWDGATTLHGMLDIPDKIVRYVNDYKVLLVEARRNDLVLHNVNNVDLFNLLEIILDKDTPKNESKKKAIQYGKEHQVDKSVVMTVAGATNSKIDYNAFEKGEVTMCTLFDEIANEGETKGRAKEIVETGYEFDFSENDILVRLQRKLDISLQQAQEYLNMFKKRAV